MAQVKLEKHKAAPPNSEISARVTWNSCFEKLELRVTGRNTNRQLHCSDQPISGQTKATHVACGPHSMGQSSRNYYNW
jgi:hypothetical protein